MAADLDGRIRLSEALAPAADAAGRARAVLFWTSLRGGVRMEFFVTDFRTEVVLRSAPRVTPGGVARWSFETAEGEP